MAQKIDMASIKSKFEKYQATDEYKKKERRAIDDYMLGRMSGGKPKKVLPLNQIGDKFVMTLLDQIEQAKAPSSRHLSGFLGTDAIEALKPWKVSSPKKIGENRYTVEVNFDGERFRPSLEPETYGGVNNIVVLLNNGYSTNGFHRVFGEWHGHGIWSIPYRTEVGFMQAAKYAFMRSFGNRYGIKEITINPEYNQ